MLLQGELNGYSPIIFGNPEKTNGSGRKQSGQEPLFSPPQIESPIKRPRIESIQAFAIFGPSFLQVSNHEDTGR